MNQHHSNEITEPGTLFHSSREDDSPAQIVHGSPFGATEESGTLRIELDGESLDWALLVAALEADSLVVSLAPTARTRMRECREGALAYFKSDPTARVYGWNQALGPLKDRPLNSADQRQFQINVLRSHAVGIGGHLPSHIARLALVIRANVLARGTTGVRPELVDRIIEMVNAGITPLMPEIGSLGTGDLQPMAAAGLCMIGEAPEAMNADGVGPLSELLAAAGLDGEFELAAGEAIALISGSAVLSACLTEAVRRASQQVTAFIGAVGLFCEATRAEKRAFDRRLHEERKIPEETLSNDLILTLFEDSDWMTPNGRRRLGEIAPRIQDSTSVRSISHSVATVLKVLGTTKEELVNEVNASTANPLVLPGIDRSEFITGGNWDCTMLGHSALSLNVQITNLAVLVKDLTGRLGSEAWSYGLPAGLAGGSVGLNSGMTLTHVVAAAIIPEMHARSTPVSSLSFPLKNGQEDHNTMAMAGVHNLVSNLNRFDSVLAVMLIMSAQGISLIEERMRGLALGTGTQQLYAWIRERIPPLEEDRPMGGEIEQMAAYVRSGEVCQSLPLTTCAAGLESAHNAVIPRD